MLPRKLRKTLQSSSYAGFFFFTVNYKYNQKEESIWGFFSFNVLFNCFKNKNVSSFWKIESRKIEEDCPRRNNDLCITQRIIETSVRGESNSKNTAGFSIHFLIVKKIFFL